MLKKEDGPSHPSDTKPRNTLAPLERKGTSDTPSNKLGKVVEFGSPKNEKAQNEKGDKPKIPSLALDSLNTHNLEHQKEPTAASNKSE